RFLEIAFRLLQQVFAASEEKGWGVRSTRPLKKGTFICEYIGEIVTNLELDERNKERAAKNEVHTYPVLLDADWGSEKILKDEEALCLDATEFGNVGRFINHRCEDANLIEMPVEIESPDHHYYHVSIVIFSGLINWFLN
ncbi:Histone-lysine N-methyltransferase SUVR4, partial [Linum perenne]